MKQGGKGQGWACSKNPPFLPSRKHNNGWKSRASSGCCRDMSKTNLCSCPLRLLSPGTLSPTAKETLQASLYGNQEESGDNRGLQQESSPQPLCGSPRRYLGIKSRRATATAPEATAPTARGMQEWGLPALHPHSERCNGSADMAWPWGACQENREKKKIFPGRWEPSPALASPQSSPRPTRSTSAPGTCPPLKAEEVAEEPCCPRRVAGCEPR